MGGESVLQGAADMADGCANTWTDSDLLSSECKSVGFDGDDCLYHLLTGGA